MEIDEYWQYIYRQNATLLWTNPNPKVNFSTTTINLDLSKYDEILVISRFTTTNALQVFTYCEVNRAASSQHIYSDSSGTYIAYRTMNTLPTEVKFNDAWFARNNESKDNKYMIPEKIYGIKLN